MSAPLFSILHPTARPQEWRKSAELWHERAANLEAIEYVLCIDERWGFRRPPENNPMDWEVLHQLNGFPHAKAFWNTGRKCMVDSVNEAARHAAGSILIVNSDDMEPPEKWDALLWESILKYDRSAGGPLNLEEPPFAVHVSTGYYDGPKASGIQILSRSRYRQLGHVFYPEYESVYADDDFLQHSYHDGVVIDARNLMFPHKHAREGDWDDVYEHQNREESRRLGRQVLERRKANGFSK